MAYPLKVGKTVTSGPGILLQRPELAAQIGSICADWACIESRLASFYGFLMGVYLPNQKGYEPPLHPMALQIFDEVQTIYSRIQLVRKLVEWVIKDDDLKADFLSVLDKLKNSGKDRNTVAHAVWGVCDDEPESIIMLPSFGHQMVYKKMDFEGFAEKIREAGQEVGRIHYAFYQRRKSQQVV